MIRLLSLFSGIGAFEQALDRIGCHYQLTGYCEIDPYASKSYAQIHGVSESLNLHDVTTIDTALISMLGGADIITYGFPCQDISVAGKQRGFTDESGNRTRSGLFFEALRIIKDLQPKYAIAENVKALTSKKFEKEFKTVLDSLDGAGYNNYWAVLNAKDYGIPQNRERVFIVSIRKDIDKGGFKFPEKMPLNIRVKDILENNVDEKYYINTEKARQLIKKLLDKNRITGVEVCDATVNAPNVRDISNAIISRYDAGISNQRSWGTAVIEPHVKQIGNIVTTGNFKNPQRGRIYDSEGISPCLNTMQGGGLEPKFIEPVVIGSTQKHASVNTDGNAPCLTAMMGLGGGNVPMVTEPLILKYERTEYGKKIRNQYEKGEINERRSNMREFTTRTDGVSNTLTTVQKDNYLFDSYRIRKLTPLECFRLMGFSDEEFYRIKGVSNTQLYKQAGNSIVVNVLEAIFNRLLTEEEKA